MQRRTYFPQRYFSVPDLVILALIGAAIYGLISIGNAWRADFQPVTEINLSYWALPRYTVLSGVRGLTAYLLSLGFTLVIGYIAAKSKTAEKILIPLLDILQSIPVLGFLPGLVLGLIAIFPHSNVGLELAAIITIFSGQVWNMTFSFYASLKSLPSDFQEASTVMGLSWWQKLLRVEMPFSAVNLAWNSLMSMAGGWFFLNVCESFNLGKHAFQLPGIGSYMAVAINAGNTGAMVMGLLAMVSLIICMDFFMWRPVLSWVHRFRLEEVPGIGPDEPLMRIMIRESQILRWVRLMYRRYWVPALEGPHGVSHLSGQFSTLIRPDSESLPEPRITPARSPARVPVRSIPAFRSPSVMRLIETAFVFAALGMIAWGCWHLFEILRQVTLVTWIMLVRNTLWSLIRVGITLFVSTLWAVPVGIWIGTSPRRTQIAQPIIQVLASFPAPMLYPLALALFFHFGINFDWGSMLLMTLGVQWYVLFNVLAGALRIPQELGYALDLMNGSRWDRWRRLFLPSVFPALVTGWVTAAGGAWNASIVAEIVNYHGATLKTSGLGATISDAAANEDFVLLAASLSVMVAVVLLLNRGIWGRAYRLAETRFRMDL